MPYNGHGAALRVRFDCAWEVTRLKRRKTRREIVRGVVADVVIVALAAACLVLYLNASDKQASHQAQIMRQAYESEAQPKRDRQRGQAIFQDLLKSIREALPGIACWGDDAMAGTAQSNLPKSLLAAIQSDLYGDLSDTFTEAAGVRVAISGMIPVHDLSFAGEGLRELAARTGARELLVGEDFTIPASTDPVAISLTDGAGQALSFVGANNARMGRVSIDGINGYFYPAEQAANGRGAALAFGRELSGEARPVPAGTPVRIESISRFDACVPVLFFRERDDLWAAEVVDILEAMVEGKDHYIVVCATDAGSLLDAALISAFGERYIRCDPSEAVDCDALADRVLTYLDMQGALDGAKSAVAEARERLRQLARG